MLRHLPTPTWGSALLFLLLPVLLSTLLSGCSLLPARFNSAGEAPVEAQAPDQGAQAFTLEVQAPPELRELLERNLELQRFRNLPDLQTSELRRLLVAADANARELLATRGYFTPTITITSQASEVADGPTAITVAVQPGEPTRVASVQWRFSGSGTQVQAFTRRQEALQRRWLLPVGEPFTQEAWDDAKNQALRRLHERSYPRARWASSRAEIDPESQQAHLFLHIDTGPAYRFGPLVVEDGERYDPDGARRLARLPSGDDFSEVEMLDAQQRLASSGYYDAVFLSLDTSAQDVAEAARAPAASPITPDDAPVPSEVTAPVLAQVRESAMQKWVFGVGVSTDSGARLSIDHLYNRLPWLGWRATSKLALDKDAQVLESQWVSLPDDANWRRFGSGQLKREVTGSYKVNSLRLRAGVSKTTGNYDRNYYLQYDTDTPHGLDAPAPSGAISANFGWTGRYFNRNTNPSRGYGLGLELGVGTTLRSQRDPFARVHLRGQSFWPLGKVTVGADTARPVQRNARLSLRSELGAVWSRQDAQVPASQLFITGGDVSVRGYSYRSIGASTEQGSLYGGRYLGVLSAEWQRPIALRGDLTHWESALFVDVGAVTNALHDVQPQVGVGAGLRWNSPVGPLQTDLAWGVQAKALRLHLRLGFTF